jgi:hypothetical protein
MDRFQTLAVFAMLFAACPLRGDSETHPDEPMIYTGMCDASAAEAIGGEFFVVANDEDNVLRIYSTARPGPPVRSFDLSRFLAVDRAEPETDLEGAARIGSRIYWITSHGRNQNGKRRLSRERLFATDIRGSGGQADLVPAGRPYKDLLRDLLNDPRLRPFKLAQASGLAPKKPGALNIEGLCATPEGRLLIGFRNPLPGGKALLVPLLNPDETIHGTRAKLGDPILLDLGGLGIREMIPSHGGYLIVAGAFDGGGRSHLYEWDGLPSAPRKWSHVRFERFNPEAVISFPEDQGKRVLILSDDGSRKVAGQRCKNIANPEKRRFRSLWIERPHSKREPRPSESLEDRPGN